MWLIVLLHDYSIYESYGYDAVIDAREMVIDVHCMFWRTDGPTAKPNYEAAC